MKLYEIANEYQIVLREAINEETGEVNEQAIARLDEIQDVGQKKSIAVASYIKNLEAEQDAIDIAIKNMQARKKRLEKESNFYCNYLQFNMERCRINEIRCPYFVAKLRTNRLSVDENATNMDQLPNEYKRVKTIVEMDKTKMLEEHKNGVIIPGAAFKQTVSLNIR